MSRRRADRGFTLIEVLAVVALVGIVLTFALGFYSDLSRQTAAASDHTRDIRRASAILDRVARDFEGAYLVMKPPLVDPIEHPWLFVAESEQGLGGADHVKFVTRNHDPSRSGAAESSFAMVAYSVVDDGDDDGVSLYRWSSPRLPESLDRNFPLTDDEGSYLMAEGLGSFALRFISEAGEEFEDWDSTTLAQSSTLPRAVDIEVAMLDDDPDDELEPEHFTRRVLIPMRPLDMQALLDPTGATSSGRDDEERDEDGDGKPDDKDGNDNPQNDGPSLTVGECIVCSGASGDMATSMFCGLAQTHPGMPWNPADAAQLPPQFQSLVSPHCR